jgi:hypothetical protein
VPTMRLGPVSTRLCHARSPTILPPQLGRSDCSREGAARSSSRLAPTRSTEARAAQKDQPARNRLPHKRMGYIARATAAEVRPPQLAMATTIPCPACNKPMEECDRTFKCESCRETIIFFAVKDAAPFIAAIADRAAKRIEEPPQLPPSAQHALTAPIPRLPLRARSAEAYSLDPRGDYFSTC